MIEKEYTREQSLRWIRWQEREFTPGSLRMLESLSYQYHTASSGEKRLWAVCARCWASKPEQKLNVVIAEFPGSGDNSLGWICDDCAVEEGLKW